MTVTGSTLRLAWKQPMCESPEILVWVIAGLYAAILGLWAATVFVALKRKG